MQLAVLPSCLSEHQVAIYCKYECKHIYVTITYRHTYIYICTCIYVYVASESKVECSCKKNVFLGQSGYFNNENCGK